MCTGVGAVMGVQTGKVLDYKTCNKRCQTCEVSNRLGLEIKSHDCRKNFEGSSKSMEPCAASELFKRKDPNVRYHAMIGDDDSSTIAKIHQEVDENVSKISDIQHVKRNLEGDLLKIKRETQGADWKCVQVCQTIFFVCHCTK